MNTEKIIPKKELIIDQRYIGLGRNFNEGIWNGVAFVGQRYKFGRLEYDEEYHWDDGYPYGTFKPLKLAR